MGAQTPERDVKMRIGLGYDVHRLVEGRRLILGGVTIPHPRGLLGHSDADVLTHAVCDALLGAAGEGDIGTHFPDSSPKYKDIASLELLSRTCDMIRRKGYEIANIDATVIAEAPKIQPYRDQMVRNLAGAAQIDPGCVSIKGTTAEKLGSIGKGEGIAAICVALIQ
jgi:2-C-methyl-D-erythritol 2,4-cyclodiphosphate synthase